MSQTSSPNPNLQDAEALWSSPNAGSEALPEVLLEATPGDGQRWADSRPTAKSVTPITPEPQLAVGEMLEAPKMIFPVDRSSEAKLSPKARQTQYREGRWGRLPLRTKVVVLAAALGILPSLALGLVNYSSQSRNLNQQLAASTEQRASTLDDPAAMRRRLLQGWLLQALVSGGVMALVAGLLATRATLPLLQAVEAVKAMGEGRLDVRLPVKGEDELATLAATLNELASQLESYTAEQQEAAARASWLAQVGTDTKNLVTQEQLADRIQQMLDESRVFLGVDRMVIYRFNEDLSGFVEYESVKEGWPMALDLQIQDACIPQALIDQYKKGRVVAAANVDDAGFHPEHLKLMDLLNVQANLVVPILDGEDLYGLLVTHHCERNHDWSESEVGFTKQLAGQITVSQIVFNAQTARGLAEVQAQAEKERTEELQRRVLQLLMEVDPVSQGDLTIRAKVTEDEIGTVADSYNATIESLRRLVTEVQTAVLQVSATASDSGEAMQVLSLGAEKQTREITEALSSIEQMAQSIRQVTENAIQAEAAVQQAAETVKQGDTAMDETVEGIFAIRETVGEAAKKVKRLGESSQKISKVVNLIGSFAEQTNLLALNASIEAAHAGEEGRGFAVVADEVRSLARQSAAATAEIEALVTEIQAETNQVAAAMESGTAQVVTGTQRVEAARKNLTQIAAVSEQISQLVAAIAQATTEQSQASEAVSLAMGDVAAIATDTSASASQVSQSIGALMAVAQSLELSMGQFKVD